MKQLNPWRRPEEEPFTWKQAFQLTFHWGQTGKDSWVLRLVGRAHTYWAVQLCIFPAFYLNSTLKLGILLIDLWEPLDHFVPFSNVTALDKSFPALQEKIGALVNCLFGWLNRACWTQAVTTSTKCFLLVSITLSQWSSVTGWSLSAMSCSFSRDLGRLGSLSFGLLTDYKRIRRDLSLYISLTKLSHKSDVSQSGRKAGRGTLSHRL